MKIKLLFLLFSISFGMNALQVKAQSNFLNINKWDGSQKSIDLSNFDKLTFSATDLIINYKNGIPESVQTSDIRKILFATSSAINNIADNNASTIRIFPNPSNDYIVLTQAPKNKKVTICSINGMEVMQLLNYNESDKIDIRQLAKGIYLLKADGQSIKLLKL